MNSFEISEKINGDITDISVTSRLSCDDTFLFSYSIISEIMGGVDGEPVLSMKDYIIKSKTIEYFTDYPLPESIEEQFSLIYDTDIYKHIVNHAEFNNEVYISMLQNIDKQINFELDRIAHKSKIDELADTINEIVQKFDEGLDVGKISAALEKLQGMEKIDEKALVKAFVEQKKPGRKKKVAE